MNRAVSPAWRRTGIRLATVVLATGCVAVLPAVSAVSAVSTASALAAPARHVTTSWGHVNAPTTQAKPVVLPGNGRSWALRTR